MEGISGEIDLLRTGRRKEVRTVRALAQGFENIIVLANDMTKTNDTMDVILSTYLSTIGITTVSEEVMNMTTGNLMDTLAKLGVDGVGELK